MARNILKDDPLDKDRPDLMKRAVYRGVGREVPEENSASKQVGVNEGVLTEVQESASTDSNERDSDDWRQSVRERAQELGSKRTGPQMRFNADIDEDLHRQLRLHCLARGLSLKQFLPALLEEYLKEGV
jgi:hypothetical protein